MINIIDSKSDPNINKNIFTSVQYHFFFYSIYNFSEERFETVFLINSANDCVLRLSYECRLHR
jgi:hypothetical protein